MKSLAQEDGWQKGKNIMLSFNFPGAPTLIATPAKSFEVAENGEITITADFDGNPQPTAEIEFPHSGTKTPMTVRMMYSFIYRADFVIKPVLASHCGRTVVTRMKNKIGEIEETSTINVICKTTSFPFPMTSFLVKDWL